MNSRTCFLLAMFFSGVASADTEPNAENWVDFTSQFQKFFDTHQSDFDSINSLIHGQRPYSTERDGDHGLRIQWTRDSEKIDAPDDLEERLLPLFQKTKVYGVQHEPPVTQYGLTVAMMSYKDFEVLPVYVHASSLDNPAFCTEELLLNTESDHGGCLLPLNQKDWFVTLTWVRSS